MKMGFNILGMLVSIIIDQCLIVNVMDNKLLNCLLHFTSFGVK